VSHQIPTLRSASEEEQLGDQSIDLAAPLRRGSTGGTARPGLGEKVDERSDVGLADLETLPGIETVQPAVPCGPPIPRRATCSPGVICGAQQAAYARCEVL
jgi:hypothetical protein